MDMNEKITTILTSDGLLMSRDDMLQYMPIDSLNSKKFFNKHDFRDY